MKLPADQSVFTSIRSPMGEGYRLIAASPGVSNSERTEITQRSVSHDGLCNESDSAIGLSSYRLTTGRYCIGYSCYAGTEQTCRGGNRVYTHIAILDREAFEQFKFDPVLVHAAIGQAIGNSRILNPVTRLDPLELVIPEQNLQPPFQMDHVCQIIESALSNNLSIVVDAPSPFETFQWLLMAIPASIRECVSVTIGLKFSLARHIQLTFIEHDQGETKRIIRGHNIQWHDMEAPAPKSAWPVNGWMNLVSQRWQEGRYQDIVKLTDSLSMPIKPADLDQIASICNDIEQIKSAPAALLERLIIKYAGFQITNQAQYSLIRDFRSAAKSRAAHLQECQSV